MPERFLAALSPGLDIQATSVAYPERTFSGTIVSVDSRVDPVTRAILVRAEIPNPDGALRAGMLLTVRVLRPPREVLAVPEIAIEQIGTESFVYVVGAEAAVRREKVTLGARQDSLVEVRSGLEAGTRIVRDGTVKLREGSKIIDAGRLEVKKE
jgi:membrane fusion protein (multidrug efflux system)